MSEPSVESILEGCINLLLTPRVTEDVKRRAIKIAFDLGVSEGRVAGWREGTSHMLASFDKGIERLLSKVPS